MKFLVDAHLPRKLADFFTEKGHVSIHTLDLPNGNASTDKEISKRADEDGLIVITKDSDFIDSHLLFGNPQKLFLVKTGNLSNRDLIKLIADNLQEIEDGFKQSSHLEIDAENLMVY